MKNKYTAAILAFFLGGIGIHRFYLGQAGMGIAYLLFCWTFIPSLIAFFDFIAFLVMSNQAFDRKYNYQSQSQNHVQTTVVNNVYAAPHPHSNPQRTTTQENEHRNNMDALDRLFELRQKGVLSQEEFDREKSKILGNHSTGSQGSQNGGDPFLRH
jgi:TM2 domain-containing membrane protein YozV